MNDPHVEQLHYDFIAGEHVGFIDPPPIDVETAGFKCRLEDWSLTVTMKEHHADPESARLVVDPYLRSWEIQTNLREGPRSVEFKYRSADLIDRNPPTASDPKVLDVQAGSYVFMGDEVRFHVNRVVYPEPPLQFRATQDVEVMWTRFQLYRDGKEPLLSMAYACLTLLEGSTGATSRVREAFCQKYAVDRAVRDALGDIVSDRGDNEEARKLGGGATRLPLTQKEKNWVEAVVMSLIRRKAEYDANPATPLTQITMADFDTL
jgi:hypothetical protein